MLAHVDRVHGLSDPSVDRHGERFDGRQLQRVQFLDVSLRIFGLAPLDVLKVKYKTRSKGTMMPRKRRSMVLKCNANQQHGHGGTAEVV